MKKVVHWGRNGAPCCSQAGYDLLVSFITSTVTCTKCLRLLRRAR